jgi:hypothetical protein
LKDSNRLDHLEDLITLDIVTTAEEVVNTIEVEAVEEASEEIVLFSKDL